MTKQAGWISLGQVHKRLSELLESQATAEVLLFEAIRSGRIASAGDYYLDGRPDPKRTLDAGSWTDPRNVFWEESRIELRLQRLMIGPRGQTQFHLGDYHRVRLRQNDLIVEWPGFNETPAETHSSENLDLKNQGGRPTKYDWAGAGGALAGHMYGAGMQEKAELKTFLIHWFKTETKKGKVPDDKDVREFVAAAVKAFERAISKG